MRRVACLALGGLLIVACGKKGPPLAPLHLVPSPVADVSARRSGDGVRIRFLAPTSNLNGPGPVQLDRVEVYAITIAPGGITPSNRDLMTATYRVGTIAVKPAPVEGEPVPATAAADTRPGPGDRIEFTETLTPEKVKPVTLPAPPAPPVPAAPPPAATPAVPLPTYAARIYVIRGVTKSGRGGQPSGRLTIPLVDPLPAPSAVKAGFTEAAFTLSWLPPVAVADRPAPAFNAYKADGAAPLNPAPLTAPSFEHPGAAVGSEQCFVVRTVETIAGVAIESEPSSPACVTPADIFPPAAPQRLQVVPAAGAMNLSWEPNTEADLAGYVVLRGDAPGDTLQALTAEPITTPRFEDKTARPGVRYVYAVVAVDRATPRNTSAQSNRVEETAR